MTKEMLKSTANAMWCEVTKRKKELVKNYALTKSERDDLAYVTCDLGEGYIYETINQTKSELEKALENTLKARRNLICVEYDVEKRYKKR